MARTAVEYTTIDLNTLHTRTRVQTYRWRWLAHVVAYLDDCRSPLPWVVVTARVLPEWHGASNVVELPRRRA